MYFSILNLPWRTFIDETKEKREEPYDPLFLPLTKLGAKTRDRRFLCVVGEVLSLGWLKYKTFEVSLQVWQPLSSFWLFLLCWLKWYKVKRSNVTLFFTQDVNAIVALLLPSFACRCIDNNDLLSLQEILVTVWTIMHIRLDVECIWLFYYPVMWPVISFLIHGLNTSSFLQMDINAGDYDGNTVMHRACEKGRTDMVKYLLSIGAACQLINRFGCTPLHLAIRNK